MKGMNKLINHGYQRFFIKLLKVWGSLMGWLDVDLGHLNKGSRHGELWGYPIMQNGLGYKFKTKPKAIMG